MPQYVLNQGGLTAANIQSTIGQRYHVGFSNGTNFYGYNLLPDTGGQGGWHETSDLQAKDKLTQYSSTALIDRDFVNWPRVSQGDWSGGMGQPVFVNPTQYWDSDLDTSTPGYLTNRPAWNRTQPGLAASTVVTATVYNNDVYVCFGTNSTIQGITTGTVATAPANTSFIDSGGTALLYGAGNASNATLWSWNGSAFTTISNSINIGGIWAIKQGTFGDFLYYKDIAGTTLKKMDMSNNTLNIAVPFGNQNNTIIGIAPYQTGIAIATIDVGGGGDSEIWYHDGTNATLLARLYGYLATGICNCQGDLYVAAGDRGNISAPVLFKVGSTLEVVARFGLDPVLPGSSSGLIGRPVASGEWIAQLLNLPIIQNVSPNNYVALFNTLTGAWSHFGLDGVTGAVGEWQLGFTTGPVWFGKGLAGGYWDGTTTQFQYTANIQGATTTAQWQAGKLISSKFDLNTPGIQKRFRSVLVHHNPLVAQSVKVDLFVDQDPVAYNSSLTPTATVTNTTVNSGLTRLSLPNVVGQSAYIVLTLTPNVNSAQGGVYVYWYSLEITTPFSWTMTLDCTAKRRMLTGDADDQGLLGKDLAYFWRNAWENGSQLTLYHRNGTSYTVELESVELYNPSPQVTSMQQPQSDEEYFVTVKVRQVA